MRRYLVLLVFILPALACTFGASRQPTPIPPTPEPPLVVIDARDQATNTPAPTPTPRPTTRPASSGGSVAIPTGCVPRADWQSYIIQAGDTLGLIAQRTNTTTSTLATANCIANANLISVGQVIRVPQAPVITPPPIVTTPPPQGDNPGCPPPAAFEDPNQRIMIAPTVWSDGYCNIVRPGDYVFVSWPAEGTSNFTQITYYRWNDMLSRPDVIGVDTTPLDGSAISWQVPSEMRPSVIWAMAEGPGPHSSRNSASAGVVLAVR